jgi:glucose-6-phosphate isomerase
MSVIRPRPPEDPLVHLVEARVARPWQSCTLGASAKAIQAELKAHLDRLDSARSLLEDYGAQRPASRLFAILGEARRIRDAVDRLVIVSARSIPCVTRMLVASCCHPFHNDLPRGERGGRPRITWLDADADNDRLQGLLDLVAPEGRPRSRDLLDQWAILAVDASTAEEAIVAHATVLVEALRKAGEDDLGIVAERLVTVARPGSRLAAFAASLGSTDRFHDETESDAPQGVFTAAALVPAAIAGIDIVRLLEGADAMLTRFAEAPVATNPVLIDAACRHRAAREFGVVGSLFTGGGLALAELSSWAGHVRPVPACGQRESHDGGVSPPALVTHVSIDEPRRRALEPVPCVTHSPSPSISIRLPRLDEHALGQLLQFVILSAAVERRFDDTV